MYRKCTLIVLILSTVFFSSCNLPDKQPVQVQNTLPSPVVLTPESSPTPIVLCDNLYFPNSLDDRWEYSGNNTALGDYTRTDRITASSDKSFTVESTLSSVTYTVEYNCSEAGLIAVNPIQQYMGALITGPNAPVNVTLISNSGLSLPARINPGDSWQQTAEWDASANEFSMNGRFVFDYSVVGYEKVTVPFGIFDALRVNATIRIEVSGFRILAGTYTTTTWMVPEVGVIKSEGTSHVPGVDFTDRLELTGFSSTP